MKCQKSTRFYVNVNVRNTNILQEAFYFIKLSLIRIRLFVI